ncbi:hypothetical protein HK104_009327, partial [Borealophlyctis nickersoniae]
MSMHSGFLDGLRGLSALAVVYSHSGRDEYNNGGETFRWVGANAVHAFFVLSAYLLTYRSCVQWLKLRRKLEVARRERRGREGSKFDLELAD